MYAGIKLFLFFLPFLLIVFPGKAQEKNSFQVEEGYVKRINGDSSNEMVLKKVLIILPESGNILQIAAFSPYNSNEATIANESPFSSTGPAFTLTVEIDRSLIQEYLNSAKTFHAHAHLTINGITKDVLIDYIPSPSGTEEKGDFNISAFIQFNSCDYNPCEAGNEKLYLIQIKNAVVNRI
jgi:hypothetical protein